MELSVYDAAVSAPIGTATFGGNMRREREARGLTLEAVATRLGLKRAAPLSTLERGGHVPKPQTIVVYATAIGCEPRDLLAGVVTEYDQLRGSITPTAVVQPARQLAASPIEKRVLKLLELMSIDGQRLVVERIAGLAAAFPREELPRSTAPLQRTTEAKARKEPGKRKVAEG